MHCGVWDYVLRAIRCFDIGERRRCPYHSRSWNSLVNGARNNRIAIILHLERDVSVYQVETAQTTGAVSVGIITIEAEVGCTETELHFSADDPTSADCLAGDCHVVIKRESAGTPVVKLCSTTLWHNDFASSPSLTAAVSGGNVLVSVPGIAGKTLNWTVKSGI